MAITKNTESSVTERPASIDEVPGRSSFGEIPLTDFSSLSEEDRKIAALGYKPVLKREFGAFASFSFALSISGVFATVVTTAIYPLYAGGAPAMVWCWFIGTFGCMSIALSVAELVSAYPSSGALYYATSQLVPESQVAVASWIIGWLNLLGQVAGTASTDYGCAQLLLAAVAIGTDFEYTPDADQTVAVMIGIVAIHGLINTLSTKWLDRITKYYAVFHIISLVACCIALLVCQKNKHSAHYVFIEVQSQNNGWASPGFGFLFGLLSIGWVCTDYTAIAACAEEIKDAAVAAPRSIALALSMTCFLGLVLNIVLAFTMGTLDGDDGILSNTIGQPIAQVFFNVLGKKGGLVFTIAAFIVLNFTGITALQANARTIWALARDEMLPGSRFWYKISKYTGTPIIAVWLNVLFCIAINLVGLASQPAIFAVFSCTAIALDLSYCVPIACRLIYWKRLAAEGRPYVPGPWNLGRFSFAVNLYAVVWTGVVSIIFLFPNILPVTAQTMNYASVILVGILVFAWFYWILYGHNRYYGPRGGDGADKRRASLIGRLESKGKSTKGISSAN
ncbi:polyamine transporter tpo5 [Savitreella phatthalungensis]